MTQSHSLATLAALSLLVAGTSIAQAGQQPENTQTHSVLPMEVAASIHFREIGPALMGGRVTAVAGVVGRPDTYYVGAADGGIFRTDNGGTTWKALFQHQRVASIGALAIDPRNPSVIWAGTGEANVRNDVSFGDGVYESTDGGLAWKHVGLNHTFQISRIVVNPLDSDTVLVAAMGSPWVDSADRGVYRTTDGGKSWQKVLYKGPGVGIADLAIDPQNPEMVFAATYRFRRTPWSYSDGGPEDAIYRSTDGGATWKRLRGNGLPQQAVGRIGLAIAPSAPSIVYAVIASKEGVLWRSEDHGEHWTLVNKNYLVDARPFYFSRLVVDPKNPDHVFALSMSIFESIDAGHTFNVSGEKLHDDHHSMWIDPDGSGRIIDGNDGGVAISRDNGKEWSFINNFPVGQLYHVAVGRGIRFEVCAGLQDNSSWCGLSWSKDPSGIRDQTWFQLNAGDGMYAIPAADNPDLIYSSTQNGLLTIFDRATAISHNIQPYPRYFLGESVANFPYRFDWEAGLAVSPSDPKVLYLGGNVLFKSADRGNTWKVISPDLTRNDKSKQGSSGGPVIKDNSGSEVYDAILSISVAPSNPDVIWVGTDDGEVQLTRDGGKSWTNVTTSIHGLPAWSRIESIDVSPTDPGDALIAVDRHFSGDFRPYLFHTADYGGRWKSVSGNLPPDVYAHVIRRDLHNPSLYYAGLENGLYVSWDAGRHWYLLGLGLPHAAIYDIALDARDNDLVVATHGRSLWILDDLTPFQGFDPQAPHAKLVLFKPEDALRYRPWSYQDEIGDGVFWGQNPRYGAAVSYYLPDAVSGGGAKLVITDASGQVVRTLKDFHEGKRVASAPRNHAAANAVKSDMSKTAESGARTALHRVYWDLHADGLPSGPKEGPLVPPGTYTLTLRIGGQTASQTLTVVGDPAGRASIAATHQHYQLARSVLHELSQLEIALNRLNAINQQAEALRAVVKYTPAQITVDETIDSFVHSVNAVKGEITNDMGEKAPILSVPSKVMQHLHGLENLLGNSDDAPSPAVLQISAGYDVEYQTAVAAYNHFLATDVETFNQKMSADHLTGVVPGSAVAP